MKMRNKGKVHPFTSSSSSSSYKGNSFPVLKLLPAAVLALVSALSADDLQVLAYMLTRSLKSDDKKLTGAPSKKPQCSAAHNSPALFDCDCFRCYTGFWLRWDSSPNRDLIHHAIEAFEEHLSNGEDLKKSKNRRKEKMSRRKSEKSCASGAGGAVVLDFPARNQDAVVDVAPEIEAAEKAADVEKDREAEDEPSTASPVAAAAASAACSHKALARKVLPDVMGIFNSRLWSLWSPNV